MTPDEDSIQKLLALKNLKKIELRINIPNSDYADARARQRVRKQLADKNAKKWDQTFYGYSNDGSIKPDEELTDYVRVAADTGYARGYATSPDGRKTEISTDKRPKKWHLSFSEGASLINSLRARFNGIF